VTGLDRAKTIDGPSFRFLASSTSSWNINTSCPSNSRRPNHQFHWSLDLPKRLLLSNQRRHPNPCRLASHDNAQEWVCHLPPLANSGLAYHLAHPSIWWTRGKVGRMSCVVRLQSWSPGPSWYRWWRTTRWWRLGEDMGANTEIGCW